MKNVNSNQSLEDQIIENIKLKIWKKPKVLNQAPGRGGWRMTSRLKLKKREKIFPPDPGSPDTLDYNVKNYTYKVEFQGRGKIFL